MAKFEVCSCGKHGHLVLRNGFRGTEFCYQELGLHLVRTAVQFKCLNDEEMVQVTQEILASALPKNVQEADASLVFNAEIFNHIYISHEGEVGQWSPEIIHELLQMPLEKGQIPTDLYQRASALLATTKSN
ncbi:MAG: hypothetical protein V4436_02315 [Patescibacteria group bacterium]